METPISRPKGPPGPTESHPAWRRHAAYQWDGISDMGDFFKGGFGQITRTIRI